MFTYDRLYFFLALLWSSAWNLFSKITTTKVFKGETERGSHALILWDLCLSLFLLWGYSWIAWQCGSELGGSGKRPSVSLLKLAQAITGRWHNFCIPSFEISFLFIKAAQEDERHTTTLTKCVLWQIMYFFWQKISDMANIWYIWWQNCLFIPIPP